MCVIESKLYGSMNVIFIITIILIWKNILYLILNHNDI